MNDKRKQELTELLNEAMDSLEIRSVSGDWSLMCTDEYTEHLRKHWTSYSMDSKAIVFRFRPRIVNESTRSKLLDFMREELGQSISEDKLLTATFFVLGGHSDGIYLSELLEQFLRIAIALGADAAISAFDKCTEEESGSYKVIALLKGITLEEEKQVFEGIQLIPLPDSVSELPSYLPYTVHRGMSEDYFCSRTLLVINYSISPIFHKPVLLATTSDEFNSQKARFQTEVKGGQFPNLNETDFYEKFCQALSLACNSPVEIAHKWEWIAGDELFNVSHGVQGGITSFGHPSLFDPRIEPGDPHIEEAKRLYDILANPDSGVGEKLRIPINRWIKSKTSANYNDPIIDLGIAFESLYVPDGGGDITYKFAVRAAQHLGKNKAHRKKLLERFKQIYGCRSTVVHSGTLEKSPRFGDRRIPVSDFIKISQKLCRRSIKKVLNDRCLPDGDYWNDLILGGEAED